MLFKNSIAYGAYEKIVKDCECYISNRTVEEIKEVFNKKFPDKIDMIEVFITMTLKTVKLVKDVENSYPLEKTIRDLKDIYIYRNAKFLKCDAILSGDKDFLENKQLDIEIISPSDYLNNY